MNYLQYNCDGEKPLTFETIDSTPNKAIDDEFLNFLGQNIFSGIGLPAAFITEIENIDFAKSLSMQNSRFIRDVIVEQIALSSGYSELVRKLYHIEYKNNEKNNSRDAVKGEEAGIINFDTNNISVLFPAPASLNLTNLNEQLSNVASVIDNVMTNVDLTTRQVNDEDKDAITLQIKEEMLRKLVPNFDWSDFDEILDKVIRAHIESKLTKALSQKVEGNNTGDTSADTTGSDDEEF